MTTFNIGVKNSDIDAEKLDLMYMQKLNRSFRLFASSVAMRPIELELEAKSYFGDSPAASSSNKIWIRHDPETGRVATAKSIKRLKGLLIHELSHVLYTPRTKTTFIKDMPIQHYPTFNMLEDNRIENLIVGRMSGVKPWLTHAITTELLGDSLSPTTYLLVAGRKYLDRAIRDNARRLFDDKYPTYTAEVDRIINEYIRLTFHTVGETDTATKLIAELHNIISDMEEPIPGTPNHTKSDEAAAPSSEGGQKIAGKREIQKDMDDADEQDTDKTQPPTSGNSDDDQEDTTAGDAMRESLQKASAEANAEITQDIKDTIENLKGAPSRRKSRKKDKDDDGNGDKKVLRKVRPFRRDDPVDVTPEYNRAYHLFAKELQTVKALSDPYWERKTSEGRLNVRNLMLDGDLETAFDRWDDNMSDATDIECVVMVDASGSMEDMMSPALQSAWAIKKAMDSIEASTTVLQFGSKVSYMYHPDERAGAKPKGRDKFATGGTAPYAGLVEARDIFDMSTRAIKMLLIVTDGEWEREDDCDLVIAQLRQQGVLTGLAFLAPERFLADVDQRVADYKARGIEIDTFMQRMLGIDEDGKFLINGHSCEVVSNTTDVKALPEFARSLARMSRAKLYN